MNKMYMKTVFSILALFAYMSNKALGGEPISRETMLANIIKRDAVYDENEIYEQNKHLLCSDPEEKQQANETVDEIITKFELYATNKNSIFNLHKKYNENAYLYFNNHKDQTCVGNFHITIKHPHMYDEIVNILWDPNGAKKYNPDFVSGKVVRAYSPDLLLIQKRYKSGFMERHNYFYALAAKYKGPNVTAIVMASVNINDQNKKNKKNYENVIVKSANSFKVDIDPDEDIKNGKLNKVFVNLSGYLITKYDNMVKIIHIDSINGDTSTNAPQFYKLSHVSEIMTTLMDLSDYIDRKVHGAL
ncbi:hypothetical protein YYG_01651 [Plasmodium vinckei petteri]|uniref:Fam-a protein n=1 Tax=Plasmodium vinckei petteri TaxID=138298 RepID=W7AMX9_PLAVN|nr:hypothetical protein YYG_01651 [Plasmodium vinckei petteri]CAD2103416.1 fam-a protein [Plasmodium vinckei petteri]